MTAIHRSKVINELLRDHADAFTADQLAELDPVRSQLLRRLLRKAYDAGFKARRKRGCPRRKPVLDRPEVELLRHALYGHRELVRLQVRTALQENTACSKRDVVRFQKIISGSLALDDKLLDIVSGAWILAP